MSHYELGSIRLSDSVAQSPLRRIALVCLKGGHMLGQMALVLPALFAVTVALSSATSASFTDDTLFPTQAVVTGAWIPILTLTVDGAPEPKASYVVPPCIVLETDLAETHIVYTLTDSVLPTTGTRYTGGCIEIPHTPGTVTIKAIALHSANDAWESDEVSVSFAIAPPKTSAARSAKKDDDDEEEDDAHEVSLESPVSEASGAILPGAVMESILAVVEEEVPSALEYPPAVNGPLLDEEDTIVEPPVLEEPTDASNLDAAEEVGEVVVNPTEVESVLSDV